MATTGQKPELLETTDKIVPSASFARKSAIISPFTAQPSSPEEKRKDDTVQIIGTKTSKTVFNRSDLLNFRNRYHKGGYPVVLVRKRQESSTIKKYIFGAEYYNLFEERKPLTNQLLNGHAFLLVRGSDEFHGPIALEHLVDSTGDLNLIEALLGLNLEHQAEPQALAKKFLVAAMIKEQMLDGCDTTLANDMTVDKEHAKTQGALDQALLQCHGELGSRVAKHILGWGANPDATDPDDDFSALGTAIRFLDQPMIRILVASGADPHKETDTDISPAELVKREEYHFLASSLHMPSKP